MHRKDEILDALAERGNVAQFVSFSPQLEQQFSRVAGFGRNYRFPSIVAAAEALLERSTERSVNVRSFEPTNPKSREFVYGLRSAGDVEQTVRRLSANGLHTIINETIDVSDGGVSGVLLGDVVEFAPDDTPRCVEKPGTAAFPREIGLKFLDAVYGFSAPATFPRDHRVEFSIHPLRHGVRQEHQITWEIERVGNTKAQAEIRWPNRFSQVVGDKVFGLLIAHLHGLAVPRTTVFSRRLAPFTFGIPTGTKEPWIRTAPKVQEPGRFTTKRGWMDPFKLLAQEDPTGDAIASVLCQEGVSAQYSGAALSTQTPSGPRLTIEGTRGYGDEFMVGLKQRSPLPATTIESVRSLYRRASLKLGYVRFEWVVGNRRTWIVQFHKGASPSSGRTIFPGRPSRYLDFEVSAGLEELRRVVATLAGGGLGIRLVGEVGITSHYGDILRKAKVPSIIADATHS